MVTNGMCVFTAFNLSQYLSLRTIPFLVQYIIPKMIANFPVSEYTAGIPVSGGFEKTRWIKKNGIKKNRRRKPRRST